MGVGDLRIHLDEDGPFRPGERVGGRAVVPSEDGGKVSGGRVAFCWRTRGHGNVDRGEPDVEVQGPEDIAPGGEYAIPFDFEVPAAPISASGELVSVDWVLEATVDVPWATDPKVERVVEVVPGERKIEAGTGYRSAPRQASAREGRAVASGHQTQALLGLVVGVAFLGMVLLQISNGMPWFFALPFLGIGLFILSRKALPWLRNRAARSKIGVPAVELPSAAARGDRIPITVSLTPPGPVHVDEVSATLVCTESATKGSGKNSSTKTRIAASERAVLGSSEEIAAGATATWSGDIGVPLGVAPTFTAKSSSVTWQVLVRVAVKDWPDDEDAYPVRVDP